MSMYPQRVTVFGDENDISCIGIVSKLTTCGTLVMGLRGGPSPEGPSINNPPEGYIYLDGTDPLTPKFGGVTEIMTNPGGGLALGAAVPKTFWKPLNVRGVTVLGSNRVSSSVKVCGPPSGHAFSNPPAVGIMYNYGAAIRYIYLLPTFGLAYGDETAWLAADPTNKLPATGTIPPASGSLGNRRDGRTCIGNDDGSGALVVASAGKSGAIGFLSGDQQAAVAMYINATGVPVFDTVPNWLTYAAS